MTSSRLYVGNLPSDVRDSDVRKLFDKYGRINSIEMKMRPARGQQPFCFIEFDDSRDAKDAIRSRDGYDFDGHRLRVELTKGSGPRGPGGRPLGGDERGYGGRSPPRGGGRGGGRGTNYRILVTGLPSTGSWQDLKDHMREAGDVVFADVFRDGTGVVEYARYEDYRNALKKLDDTKFTSHERETSRIRLKEMDDNGGGRDRDRDSRDRGRGGGRDRSMSRSRSPRGGRGGGGGRRGSPVYSPVRRSRSNSRSRTPRSPRSRSPRSRSPRSRS